MRQTVNATHPTPHLPDELLVTIFHNLLDRSWVINRQRHNDIVREGLLPLSLACRRFRDIATEVYYTSNTFSIYREYCRPFCRDRATTVRYPPFKFGHLVRHLELRLACYTDELLSIGSDLSRLWRPKRALLVKGDHCIEGRGMTTDRQHMWLHTAKTYWQRHFTKLRFVKVTVELCMGFGPSRAKRAIEMMKDFPRLASVPLRSERVQVKIFVEPEWFAWPEDFPCQRVLETTLEEMMCLETPLKNGVA